MTLGTGIFLSSLLLGLILLFWITKDRVRWSRIIYWFLGGTAAIIAAFLLYLNYKPPPTKQLEYADLKLGMKQTTVNYVKGPPTNVFEDDAAKPGWQKVTAVGKLDQGRTASDFLAWSYDLSSDGRLDVEFDADKKVKAIRCYSKSYLACPSVLGLYPGSSDEEDVIERLGEPTQAAVSGVTKRMVYKPLNLMFYLSKKEVYMVHITEDLPVLPETASGE